MISRKGLKKGRFLKDWSWKIWPNHKTNFVFCSTSTKKPFPFYPLFGEVLLQLTCFKFQVGEVDRYIQVLSVNGGHESAIAPPLKFAMLTSTYNFLSKGKGKPGKFSFLQQFSWYNLCFIWVSFQIRPRLQSHQFLNSF